MAPFCTVNFGSCLQCNVRFTSRWPRGYCSESCSRIKRQAARDLAAERVRRAERLRANTRPGSCCQRCGVIIGTQYGDKRKAWCSVACLDAGASDGAARAKRAGLVRGYFNELRIFERDGWTCQLCGVKTPRRLKGTTDPRAPELDHIVPIAAGGPHVQENVQCACRKCNSRKGATPRGQSWLSGFADTREYVSKV